MLDSCLGVFSSPQMTGRYHQGMDAAYGAIDYESREYNGDKAEYAATSTREATDVQQDLTGSNASMDLDQRALAPAHEAPRAP